MNLFRLPLSCLIAQSLVNSTEVLLIWKAALSLMDDPTEIIEENGQRMTAI
jgi:hypothetical protein